jgi:(p)ppGpp synthase/HD superfamily hydrolase
MINALKSNIAATAQSPLLEISTLARFTETRALLTRFDQLLCTLQLDPDEQDHLLLAIWVSLLAHKEQEDRPDKQPYVNHPLQVALTLREKFNVTAPDLFIAALLHDSIEDQAGKTLEIFGVSPATTEQLQSEALNLIQAVFGKRVSELVAQLTNPDFDSLAKSMTARGDTRPFQAIKRDLYKEHFLNILERDPYAFMIKLSDFAQNAYTISNVGEQKRKTLRAKYGPVILAVRARLESVPPASPLFPFHELLQRELDEVYARDYSG